MKVIVFGTFDVLHRGHKYFLKQAKKHGDYLIVVVAQDRTVKMLKGRYPLKNQNKRMQEIKDLKIADMVIPGNIKNKLKIILENKPDVVCLGYDQKYFVKELKDFIKKNRMKIIIKRLKSYKPHIYKSSKLNLINNKEI